MTVTCIVPNTSAHRLTGRPLLLLQQQLNLANKRKVKHRALLRSWPTMHHRLGSLRPHRTRSHQTQLHGVTARSTLHQTLATQLLRHRPRTNSTAHAKVTAAKEFLDSLVVTVTAHARLTATVAPTKMCTVRTCQPCRPPPLQIPWRHADVFLSSVSATQIARMHPTLVTDFVMTATTTAVADGMAAIVAVRTTTTTSALTVHARIQLSHVHHQRMVWYLFQLHGIIPRLQFMETLHLTSPIRLGTTRRPTTAIRQPRWSLLRRKSSHVKAGVARAVLVALGVFVTTSASSRATVVMTKECIVLLKHRTPAHQPQQLVQQQLLLVCKTLRSRVRHPTWTVMLHRHGTTHQAPTSMTLSLLLASITLPAIIQPQTKPATIPHLGFRPRIKQPAKVTAWKGRRADLAAFATTAVWNMTIAALTSCSIVL